MSTSDEVLDPGRILPHRRTVRRGREHLARRPLEGAHPVGRRCELLVAERNVVGITTNPTIFAARCRPGSAYDAQLAALARSGASAPDAVFEITTTDVTHAADLLRPIHDATGGLDGWVSVEVGAATAHDVAGHDLRRRNGSPQDRPPERLRENPRHPRGLDAITAAIARGISINVTLIFSLDRYRAVIDAYLTGLEQAHAAGIDLRGIRSVASFFVSRVDTEIDATARRHRFGCRARAERAGGDRERPARIRDLRAAVRLGAGAARWPAGGAHLNGRSGHRRESRTRAP